MKNERIDAAPIIGCSLCSERFSGERDKKLYDFEQHLLLAHFYELAKEITPADDGF